VGVVAGFAASAVADDDGHNGKRRALRASLVGFNEVPAVSTAAKGQFYAVVSADGTSFTYWLSYTGMSENVAQSHIHVGQHHTNGGISVWLCQGTVAAPASVATQTPAYANVHSGAAGTPVVGFPGGEIRGQIH
jgi:hypothetical protein